jgi:hypothetical protein
MVSSGGTILEAQSLALRETSGTLMTELTYSISLIPTSTVRPDGLAVHGS